MHMSKLEEVIVSQPVRKIKENAQEQEQQYMRNNGKNSQTKCQPIFRPRWNKIFALVCMVAVSLDPLFMYIPIINNKDKCLTMDNTLGTTAIVLRLFTDLIYVGNIVYSVAEAFEALKREGKWKRDKILRNALEIWKHSWPVLLVDFLAILPIPQIVVLSFIPKVKGSKYLDKRKFLNFLLLSQYVPRVFRIYLSFKELTSTSNKLSTRTLWIRAALNFFLFVLGSHVFGAFWYFFSVEREIECWHQACANSTLNCDEGPRDIQLLINSCPIRTKNTTDTSEFFDFGIFLDALESDVLGSYDFPQKLVHCFWWGLRNLSSMGQNLKTSTYIWENLFAVSIFMVGLLLFCFLIGNFQTYMQMATQRSEEIKRKMKLKENEIGKWIYDNRLPKKIKTDMMFKVKQRLEEDKDVEVDVQNLLSLLPPENLKNIKRRLCFSIVTEVKILKDMDCRVLDMIYDHLKPVSYAENSQIIKEQDPLDRMLFITQGTVSVFTASCHGERSTSTNTKPKSLKKGDYYGEELVEWSLKGKCSSGYPISTTNVKSYTKVEGFTLRADDLTNAILMNAVFRVWWRFPQNLSGMNSVSPAEKWKRLTISVRQRRMAQGEKSMESLRSENDGGKSNEVR